MITQLSNFIFWAFLIRISFVGDMGSYNAFISPKNSDHVGKPKKSFHRHTNSYSGGSTQPFFLGLENNKKKSE